MRCADKMRRVGKGDIQLDLDCGEREGGKLTRTINSMFD